MDNQNIDPQQTANDEAGKTPSIDNTPKTGLDEWNERLDENLEPEGEADPEADEKAEDFQDEADENAKPA
jgi:hypothetical protein